MSKAGRKIIGAFALINQATRELNASIAACAVACQRETYAEMNEFERLCFHINDCLAVRMQYSVLHDYPAHLPRKLKKRRRKDAAQKLGELERIRAQIDAIPPACEGATRERVLAYLTEFYALSTKAERDCVSDVLSALREAHGISREALQAQVSKAVASSWEQSGQDLEAARQRSAEDTNG